MADFRLACRIFVSTTAFVSFALFYESSKRGSLDRRFNENLFTLSSSPLFLDESIVCRRSLWVPDVIMSSVEITHHACGKYKAKSRSKYLNSKFKNNFK